MDNGLPEKQARVCLQTRVIQLTQLRWCHAHDIYVVDYPTMNMPLLPPQAITGLIRKLQGACLISQNSVLSLDDPCEPPKRRRVTGACIIAELTG
ncbi:MAG TPA: hypothetical protein ENH10_08200 [Bacteroidetes bacterium]|nr:hypothetical protein [Bacteroidota bacterium]HEX05119.1 hypothetical protein [Bacteroidota bacterium]